MSKRFNFKAELDEGRYGLFWHFIAQRQLAFYRRVVLRAAPPWSVDPVVNAYHFTNVYRELDPGTKWLMHNVLGNKRLDFRQRLFLVAAYRAFATETTFEMLGVHRHLRPPHPMLPESFQSAWLLERLYKIRDQTGRHPWTSILRISPHGRTNVNVYESMSLEMGMLAEAIPFLSIRLQRANDRERAWRELLATPAIGKFLAFQILVDLCYDGPDFERSLPFDNDGWAAAGPGARLGMQLLFPGVKRWGLELENDIMRQLTRVQAHELDRRGMRWLLDRRNQPVPLSRANIQNCLCEFSKYHRYCTTKAKGKARKFDARDAYARDSLVPTGNASMLGYAVQTELIDAL